MKRLLIAPLWGLLLTLIALTLIAAAVRQALYARHRRLCGAWLAMCRRNTELVGHPGPIGVREYPGVPEARRDIAAFNRVWMLLAATALSALTLSAASFLPA